jgi:hypothetical protein
MTKENVLKMLEKYTPQTRLALLHAAKERKEIRALEATWLAEQLGLELKVNDEGTNNAND